MQLNEELLQVIVPIGVVPEGGIIRKRTGEARFTVSDSFEVKVYPYGSGVDGEEYVLEKDGCRYMVPVLDGSSYSKSVSVVRNEVEVVWFCTIEELEDACAKA